MTLSILYYDMLVKTSFLLHVGTSPFEELRNIDMIHTFPLDYMHLVLQGVFKRLLQIWTGEWNKNWTEHSLRREKLHLINKRLIDSFHIKLRLQQRCLGNSL